MKHSQKKETLEKLGVLLRQYENYKKAETEAEKNRIGDEMTYADPIVWMMYKKQAYAGSDHEINTFGDLKEHSIDHGGICAKRMRFLALFIKENYKKDILDSSEFSNNTTLENFYDCDLINKVVNDQEFVKTWESHEYFKDGGKVAKWENYSI